MNHHNTAQHCSTLLNTARHCSMTYTYSHCAHCSHYSHCSHYLCEPSPFSLIPYPFYLIPYPLSLLPYPFSLIPSPFSLLPSPFSLLPAKDQTAASLERGQGAVRGAARRRRTFPHRPRHHGLQPSPWSARDGGRGGDRRGGQEQGRGWRWGRWCWWCWWWCWWWWWWWWWWGGGGGDDGGESLV